MTFINWYILFGLAAVSLPVLIHLFNRRKARVIDWGAMQFLQGSLVNRKRKILIEEMILMALRCLMVAAMVLAIARPFAPAGSRVSWLVLLPLFFAAAILMAIATIVARRKRWRLLWLGCAAAIAVGAFFLSRNEQLLQSRFWRNSTDQDVAIVIDGSTSMAARVGGKSNFDRAIAEAGTLIESLGPQDNVMLFVAGGAIRHVTPEPISVRARPQTYLQDLQTAGGQFDPIVAIQTATDALGDSDNATKKIVLITDSQAAGWNADDSTADSGDNTSQWQLTADHMQSLPVQPKVVARFLSLPEAFENVSVGSVEMSRSVIGNDRDVTVRVRIENTGFQPIKPVALELQIDGQQVRSEEVAQIKPGQSQQINLRHRFEQPGMHTVTAKLLAEDDLADDNKRTVIAQVLESLPVLLVDGSSSNRDFERATTFAEIALAPPLESASSDSDAAPTTLVRTQVISTVAFDDSVSLQDYQVVILCDVPRLGPNAADAVAAFVEQGGGLLIALGGRAQAEFYNDWETSSDQPLVPARLGVRSQPGKNKGPRSIAVESLSLPALKSLLVDSRGDITQIAVDAYWNLQAGNDQSVIGARLDNGHPLMVTRKTGKGEVVLTAMSIDSEDSNFPLLHSFLPFLQETVFELAALAQPKLNHNSSAEITINLPPVSKDVDESKNANGSNSQVAKRATTGQQPAIRVTGPGQTDAQTARDSALKGELKTGDQQRQLRIAGASRSGVYRVEMPDESTVSFAVTQSAAESRLDPLSQSARTRPEKFLNYFQTSETGQMISAVTGDVPGHELWKYLAIAALACLLAESFATRWIALQRKTGTAESVSFVSDGERMSTFRERAQQMLKESRSA